MGQIFNSIQGEGLYFGRRQVFVRLPGCELDCAYCDTVDFRAFKPETCQVETRPGSTRLRNVPNPMSHGKVLRHIKGLSTPDTHSVSLTGGEPLMAGDFLLDITRACKGAGLKTYLETNGASGKAMSRVVRQIDIAAIDIKLPEHCAVPVKSWRRLFDEELSCIKTSLENGVETFVKIVVLRSTRERTIAQVCRELSKIGAVPLVLQPVTPSRRIRSSPSMAQMYRLSRAAAKAGVEDIVIIPQIHKIMGIL